MLTDRFFIFDLDGTLSDPAIGIERSLNHALQSLGYPPVSHERIGRYIGPPLDNIFADIIGTEDPESIAALVAGYRECYAELGYLENRLYPGIPKALGQLSERGLRMGICTSKRRDFAERILENFGIRHYFRFVSGGDVDVQKEQQLAALLFSGEIPHFAAMFGDRDVDVHAAKANGLLSVAVLWGYGSREELAAACPDMLLNRPADLVLHLPDMLEYTRIKKSQNV
jgi:phosphoglycolate phosphatase